MTTAKQKYQSVTGDSSLVRPRYSPGLLLEDDDLTAAVTYTQGMVRLLFRSLFGCGVICGLDVKAEVSCNGTRVDATIGRGVALDCMGNPLEVTKSTPIAFNCVCDPVPEWLWVVLCYRESCCRPKDVSCAADDDGQIVQTRVKEGYEVRLYSSFPKCACSCEEPPEGTTKRKGPCCDDEDDDEDVVTTTPAAQATAAAAKSKQTIVGAADVFSADETFDRARGTQPKLPEVCACYEDHLEGKCDCDCCCPCVLIGKIHTTVNTDGDDVDRKSTDPQALAVDRSGVRWIRPVLVGYYKCLKQFTKVTGTPEDRRVGNILGKKPGTVRRATPTK
jgi:hypothetical protein